MAEHRGPLQSPLGRFVERVNGGRISSGARLVTGVEMGFEELLVEGLEDSPAVPGGSVSTVVPAGARAIKIEFVPDPANLLALVPGPALAADGDAVTSTEGYRLDAGSFFPPGARAIKIADVMSVDAADVAAWLSPRNPEDGPTFDPEGTAVVLFSGERPPSELFGTREDEPDWTPVEAGESLDPATTVFAIGGQELFDADEAATWDAVFDAGVPAPLSGATFGMAVLSTPNATVAGESVSPLVRLDTSDLLRSESARRLLGQAGVSDAENIEWLAGPERIEVEDEMSVTVFGQATDGMELFGGVVSGDDGPWRVLVNVVRATGEDHVIVTGVHRQAVGTAESGGTLTDPDTVQQTRELMADAVARLE